MVKRYFVIQVNFKIMIVIDIIFLVNFYCCDRSLIWEYSFFKCKKYVFLIDKLGDYIVRNYFFSFLNGQYYR